MSDFDGNWLALREPVDVRSRAILPLELVRQRRREGALRVLDLGTGTGANLRYLAPRIGGAQSWLLTDTAPRLLGAIGTRMRAWAGSHGYRLTGGTDAAEITGPRFRCVYRLLEIDLSRQLSQLPIPGQDFVTASALLDLVSEQWVEALIERCRAACAQVLFALTYDGRVECRPDLIGDAPVLAAANRHQCGDKGFGPAMGPLAWEKTAERLSRRGYRVLREPSDWRLGPAESELQSELVAGWVSAAAQIDPDLEARLQSWHRHRNRFLLHGLSRITVGHQDLFASCDDEAPSVRGFA